MSAGCAIESHDHFLVKKKNIACLISDLYV